MGQSPKQKLEIQKAAASAQEAAEALETLADEAAGDEGSMQGLLAQAEAQSQRLQARGLTTVKVVQVAEHQVFVDVGEKLEGVVPAADFPAGALPAVGDEIPVILVKRGGVDRPAQLSHRKAREELGWQRLRESCAGKHRVSGTVTQAVKGGFLVDLDGVGAFLPLSLADRRPLPKGATLTGKRSAFVIVEMDAAARRLVVSRRQVQEEDFRTQKRKRIGNFRAGQVVEGKVTSLTGFGAFVDLGGIEGLVALGDLSWRPVAHPQEVVKPGQKLKVKVLATSTDELKITLGLRQLQENPADALRRRFRVGAKVQGRVVSVGPEGIAVEVGPGVRGFVPARDFEDRPRRGEPPPPRPMTQKPGDAVGAIVEGVNPRRFELTLSLRKYDQMEERETVRKYMKGGPRLTLGDLLRPEAAES